MRCVYESEDDGSLSWDIYKNRQKTKFIQKSVIEICYLPTIQKPRKKETALMKAKILYINVAICITTKEIICVSEVNDWLILITEK